MTNTQRSSSHGKLTVAIAVAALVVVLALLSAFVWPGWAMKRNADAVVNPVQSTSAEPTTPSISAKALPTNSSDLLKAMPDSVLNFARTEASPSATWTAASPLEEYTLTYSTGNAAKDVTLIVAQWSSADSSTSQYNALTGALKGTELATGNVKVSGSPMGTYTVKTDAGDSKKATAVWRNDTVVFEASGATASVQRFYQKFPM
ncbi:MAG: hypothetical protein LKI88_02590 [Bifidobacterium sp.]|jgi:hypothetical protein|nr:hypothetical protein [Bifidobacterium sp.]MCI1864809.1 hypothetical protein [Bifidobacterium sp.]